MIGRFWYAESPCGKHITVRLAWQNGSARARVEPPAGVADKLGDDDIPLRADDEFMSLPIALGYAVLIAGLSETSLTVTGDVTAWPQEWGSLSERPRRPRPLPHTA